MRKKTIAGVVNLIDFYTRNVERKDYLVGVVFRKESKVKNLVFRRRRIKDETRKEISELL